MCIATITKKQYDDFMYRDLLSFTGIAKLQAAFDFKKRYKITDISYKPGQVILTFTTDEAKTWFLLNV